MRWPGHAAKGSRAARPSLCCRRSLLLFSLCRRLACWRGRLAASGRTAGCLGSCTLGRRRLCARLWHCPLLRRRGHRCNGHRRLLLLSGSDRLRLNCCSSRRDGRLNSHRCRLLDRGGGPCRCLLQLGRGLLHGLLQRRGGIGCGASARGGLGLDQLPGLLLLLRGGWEGGWEVSGQQRRAVNGRETLSSQCTQIV